MSRDSCGESQLVVGCDTQIRLGRQSGLHYVPKVFPALRTRVTRPARTTFPHHLLPEEETVVRTQPPLRQVRNAPVAVEPAKAQSFQRHVPHQVFYEVEIRGAPFFVRSNRLSESTDELLHIRHLRFPYRKALPRIRLPASPELNRTHVARTFCVYPPPERTARRTDDLIHKWLQQRGQIGGPLRAQKTRPVDMP